MRTGTSPFKHPLWFALGHPPISGRARMCVCVRAGVCVCVCECVPPRDGLMRLVFVLQAAKTENVPGVDEFFLYKLEARRWDLVG